MFGFTDGCLPMNRWDELNSFFEKSGAKVIFGLNALTGRSVNPGGTSTGPWDYANTESLIRYTVENKYSVHGWELGNELNANGIGTSVSADQYAADTIALYNIVQNIYKGKEEKPLILAPGGFFDLKWFKEYIDLANNSLNVVTHHIYNLGPGVDENLVEKILDPSYLDGEANTFRSLHDILRNSTTTSTTAWVGEAGGAYNSGRNNVTNAFVFSFWYLDQLGMSSTYDTKTYCRQSLVGGNYGLLNTASYIPNPDYYSALLWHRLMGRNVLSTSFSASNKIRAYAHCARKSKGITVLLINLDGKTTVQANIDSNNYLKSYHIHNSYHSFRKSKLIHMPHASKNATMARAEYHLTAKNGNLQSQSMMLNGNILSVDSSGKIPTMDPIYIDPSRPVVVGPYSIVFAHIPYIVPPACW